MSCLWLLWENNGGGGGGVSAPENSVAPVASGTNEVGETLSVTNGTWSNSPTGYTYQWRRDASNISGATSNTYTLVSADAETDVDCVVTASNAGGSNSADSNDITIAAESSYLDGVLSSTVMDLDATVADSYGGTGETWANLIASPADGESQTTYDFWLGVDGDTDGDEPTFTGSAGNAAAYFQTDAGDFFTIKGGNTAFLNAIHKTTGGTDFWFAFVGQIDSNAVTGQAAICGTTASYTTGDGFSMRHYTSAQGHSLIAQQATDATNDTEIAIGDDDITRGGYYFMMASFDASAGTLRIWANTLTADEKSWTFAANTDDAANAFRIGDNGYGSQKFYKGRIVHFSMGNEYIGDTEAAAIIAHLEARHSRDYTP